jgi:hypothetical protein
MTMNGFENGRRRRPGKWQLGGDHSLVWRDGLVQLVPIAEATTAERATGIASIEALAASIVSRFVRSKRAHMSDDRMADAIGYLIEHAWIEGNRFDGRGRLAGFVTARLRWRLVDWYRDEFERRRCATCGGREGRDHDARCDARQFVEVYSLNADDGDRRPGTVMPSRLYTDSHAAGVPLVIERNIEAAHEALEVAAPDTGRDDDGAFAGLDLSDAARWALEHVAAPLAAGYTMAEIAARLGRSRASVSAALAELRCELAALGLAP